MSGIEFASGVCNDLRGLRVVSLRLVEGEHIDRGRFMTDQRHIHHTLRINRAPVLTLWAAVVAERLGFTSGGGAYAGARRRRA
jgi:hypothetical protein